MTSWAFRSHSLHFLGPTPTSSLEVSLFRIIVSRFRLDFVSQSGAILHSEAWLQRIPIPLCLLPCLCPLTHYGWYIFQCYHMPSSNSRQPSILLLPPAVPSTYFPCLVSTSNLSNLRSFCVSVVLWLLVKRTCCANGTFFLISALSSPKHFPTSWFIGVCLVVSISYMLMVLPNHLIPTIIHRCRLINVFALYE